MARKIEDKFFLENEIRTYWDIRDMELFPYMYGWACEERAQEGHIFCCGWCY